MANFFESQSHITHKLVEDLDHVELHIFKKGKDRSEVKVFVEHMPLALAKEELSKVGLLDETYSDL